MITPAEATQLTAKEIAGLEQWEQIIDSDIRGRTPRYGHAWSQLDSTVTPKMCDELIRRYSEAGWSVKLHDDQRDGQSLEFRIP